MERATYIALTWVENPANQDGLQLKYRRLQEEDNAVRSTGYMQLYYTCHRLNEVEVCYYRPLDGISKELIINSVAALDRCSCKCLGISKGYK